MHCVQLYCIDDPYDGDDDDDATGIKIRVNLDMGKGENIYLENGFIQFFQTVLCLPTHLFQLSNN